MTLAPDELLALVLADPKRAATEAVRTARSAAVRGDAATRSAAWRAAGLAAHALYDYAEAGRLLRRAIRVAQAAAEVTAEAEARMSYSLVLDDIGHPAEALREAERACGRLRGPALGRARMQQALILRRVGRTREAMRGYDAALETFRLTGDVAWEARTLGNRGVLHGFLGSTAAAVADLEAAEALFASLGLDAAVARTQHNIGVMYAWAGDTVAALEQYERARAQMGAVGATAWTEQNRAEFLLSCRLLPEAREAASASLTAARAGRNAQLRGESQILAARIELAAGAAGLARTLAARARAMFRHQGRPAWAALAHRVEVGARIALAGPDRRAARTLDEIGDALAAAAMHPAAWEAWIEAAWCAAVAGDAPLAQRCLAKAAPARTAAPAPLRARMWHVRAQLAVNAGDTATAKRRAGAGYREIERNQASLGATELGIRRGADGVDLAALRLRLALRDGARGDVLRWLQRVRSAALRLPPARPADDPRVVELLAELRSVSSAIGEGQTEARLLRRQRAIENDIRQRSWRSGAGAADGAQRQPTRADLVGLLGERVLVEMFALDGTLHALVLRDARLHLRALCPVGPIGAEIAALRFAVRRRLVYAGPVAAQATAAAALARADGALSYSAQALEKLLLAPLDDLIGDRPLVLAPTDVLHALPWSVLPRCRGRAVSVTPSSWLWWQAAQRGAGGGGEVLVAGPEPAHARAEIDALGADRPGARVLVGAGATVERTLVALDGARLAHVASHGVFRADNPLFSHLVLGDGALTVYDLGRLRRAPELLILSSCDAGLSAVHPGDELQGLAVALLGLGTRCVIASLGLVDDVATAALMVDLHRRLRAGAAPAQALAAAQAAAPGLNPGAANFICIGAG